MSAPVSWCSHGCVIAATCMQLGRYTANLIWRLPISWPNGGRRLKDPTARRPRPAHYGSLLSHVKGHEPAAAIVESRETVLLSASVGPMLTVAVDCHSVTATPGCCERHVAWPRTCS